MERNNSNSRDNNQLNTIIMEILNALNKVRNFYCNLNEYTCVSLFGENLGKHIWNKFVEKHRRNFIEWYFDLDKNCRVTIAKAIENA